jgi:leucyl-tRNA synthetase
VPEVVADKYGVDVVRMYLMFMGPFDATMAWNEKTLMGVKRFLERFEKYVLKQVDGLVKEKGVIAVVNNVFFNKTIDNITKDLEHFGFNTAIAKLMALLNELNVNEGYIRKDYIDILIKLIAPFAPYTAEELWSKLSNDDSVHAAEWPKADPKYLIEEEISVAVAVNGKVRDQILINNEELIINNKEKVILKAKELEVVKKWIEGKEIVKEIYIPGKMINFVVRE